MMSTSCRKLLLSFCLCQIFVSTIALQTCRYSRTRNGVCIPFEQCEEIRGKVYFPNEECDGITTCCPNPLTTKPANDRIFNGIMPSGHTDNANPVTLSPPAARVGKKLDPIDMKRTVLSVPEVSQNKFQNPPKEILKQISGDLDINQDLPPALLKIFDKATADVEPPANIDLKMPTAKNRACNIYEDDPKVLYNFPKSFDAHNRDINQTLPPALLKIFVTPTADLMSPVTFKPEIPHTDFWNPHQGDRSGSGNSPFHVPNISAAQGKPDEEFFNRLLKANTQQSIGKSNEDLIFFPDTAPTRVAPGIPSKVVWPQTKVDNTKRLPILNRNQPGAMLKPNRHVTHVTTTAPPTTSTTTTTTTTTTEQIPYFDKEFYRRLGLAFGSKYDKYNQQQVVTTAKAVVDSTRKQINQENVTGQQKFVENLNPMGLDKLSLSKCGFVHFNHDSSKSNVETNIAEYPWLALLRYDVGNNGKNFSCGGSLITERFVLTAASCITESLVGVQLGANEITNKDCSSKKNCYKISKILKHKDYNPETGRKDIALIKLKTRVGRSKNIKPVCLPTKPEYFDVTYDEKALTIAGWALTREESTTTPIKHTLSRTKSQVCQANHPKVSQQSKMCLAGSDLQSSTCSGDHGGPVFWLVDDDKKIFTQIGIVPQEMYKCGGGDKAIPFYVESIGDSMDWITSVIAEEN